MKTFKLKGDGVSIINKLAIFVTFGLMVLFNTLGFNNLLILLTSVLFLFASVRAFRSYKASLKIINISDSEIIFFKHINKKPEVTFRIGQFYFEENYHILIVYTIKGGVKYKIRKKDWDKEVLQLITSYGIPSTENKNSEVDIVDKVDNSLSFIYIIKKLLRGLID